MAEIFGQDGTLGQKLTGQQFDAMLGELSMLPFLTSAADEILYITSEGQSAGQDEKELFELVSRQIRLEPALLARLLHLANRDSDRQIITPAEALEKVSLPVFVGEIRSAVAGGLDHSDRLARAGLDKHTVGMQCVATALACQRLAGMLPLPLESEEAYVCGLLGDLGVLGLIAVVPKSFRRASEASGEVFVENIADSQREIIGIDQATAGRRLARFWSLPEVLENVIWLHCGAVEAVPESAAGRMFILLTGLAHGIASRAGLAPASNAQTAVEINSLAQSLGLSGQAVDELTDELPALTDQHFPLDVATGIDQARASLAASAAVDLGRSTQQLRQQCEALSSQAGSLDILSDFFGRLGPNVTVAQSLAAVVFALGKAGPVLPTPAEPIIGYAINAPEQTVLLVRCDGTLTPTWRSLPQRAGFEPTAGIGDSTSASEVADSLLGPARLLDQWVNLAGFRHLKLTGLGRWVGGLFCPSGWFADRPGSLPSALVDSLAGVLAIVQQRCRAVTLAEQLAGASGRLARRERLLAEIKLQEVVGDMAAGAAHELNNPLAVVSGRAQFMAQKATDPDDQKVWQQVADQAQRASDIITELMALACPDEPQPEPIDPVSLLNEASEAFGNSDHATKAASPQVDIEIEAGTGAIWADRAQIRDVLVELMCNAATATRAGLKISLSAQAETAGKAILLKVVDNGPGMDAQTLAKAFTPFFSHQRAGRRPGLGLPRARRLIENNGGRMSISSAVSQGTAVQIFLPAAQGGQSK